MMEYTEQYLKDHAENIVEVFLDDREMSVYVQILDYTKVDPDSSADNPDDYYGYEEVNWEYICCSQWNEELEVEEYYFSDEPEFTGNEIIIIDEVCCRYAAKKAYEDQLEYEEGKVDYYD